jgi:double-strand break repair protein MRE11
VKTTTRGRKKVVEPDSDEEEDVPMVDLRDDDEDEEDDEEVVPAKTTARARKAAAPKPAAPKPAPAKKTAASATKRATTSGRGKAATGIQTQLNFAPSTQTQRAAANDSQASNALFHRNVINVPSDDEDIDDEDEFVPMSTQMSTRSRATGKR